MTEQDTTFQLTQQVAVTPEQRIETPDKAAQLTGLPVNRIGVVRLQLEKLLSEGILIELDIHGESMFSCVADWPEFGIEPNEQIRAIRLRRGQKHLIDEKRISDLRTVTTRMRQWLSKMTWEVTGFKPWKYLNYKRYDQWVEKWATLLTQFEAVKNDILDHYDQDMDHLRSDYIEIANRSWQSLSSLGYSEVVYAGRKFTDQIAFTEQMISMVMAKVPTREFIQKNLTADYRVSVLQGREQIEEQFVRSEKIKAKAERIRNKTAAEKEKAYAESNLLNERLRHEREQNMLAEDEKRAKIDAMIRAEAAHIREQFAETVSPIEEVFTQVRSQMADICLDAAESVKKNGYVRGKVAEKLRGLVEFYQLISIEDDPKLLEKLHSLKEIIGSRADEREKDAPERSIDDVINALNGVIDLQASVREDLKEGPNRASMIF